MKTIREQVEARRQTKLKAIERQVKTGRLVVRQMTPEERAEFSDVKATTEAARRTGAA
jgi:hypothetical protein